MVLLHDPGWVPSLGYQQTVPDCWPAVDVLRDFGILEAVCPVWAVVVVVWGCQVVCSCRSSDCPVERQVDFEAAVAVGQHLLVVPACSRLAAVAEETENPLSTQTSLVAQPCCDNLRSNDRKLGNADTTDRLRPVSVDLGRRKSFSSADRLAVLRLPASATPRPQPCSSCGIWPASQTLPSRWPSSDPSSSTSARTDPSSSADDAAPSDRMVLDGPPYLEPIRRSYSECQPAACPVPSESRPTSTRSAHTRSPRWTSCFRRSRRASGELPRPACLREAATTWRSIARWRPCPTWWQSCASFAPLPMALTGSESTPACSPTTARMNPDRSS